MTPRVDIIGVEMYDTWRNKLFFKYKYSRMPV